MLPYNISIKYFVRIFEDIDCIDYMGDFTKRMGFVYYN